MRYLILLLVVFGSLKSAAQWRLQLQSGISNSLNASKKDSIFSAKTSGLHVQGRAVYFWGHMGLGLTLGSLQRTVRNDANSVGPPSFLSPSARFLREGGGLKAFYALLGPEFCMACGSKIKFNVGVRGGVSILQTKTFQLNDQGTLFYKNDVISKAPFTINIGAGAHYFATSHLGIGAMIDYHRFVVKANNIDLRRGATNIKTLKTAQNIINAGLSLTYKF